MEKRFGVQESSASYSYSSGRRGSPREAGGSRFGRDEQSGSSGMGRFGQFTSASSGGSKFGGAESYEPPRAKGASGDGAALLSVPDVGWSKKELLDSALRSQRSLSKLTLELEERKQESQRLSFELEESQGVQYSTGMFVPAYLWVGQSIGQTLARLHFNYFAMFFNSPQTSGETIAADAVTTCRCDRTV